MLAYIAAPWIRHGYYLDFSEKDFGHRSSSSQVSEPWPYARCARTCLPTCFGAVSELDHLKIWNPSGSPVRHAFFSHEQNRIFFRTWDKVETTSMKGMNRPIHRRTANIAYIFKYIWFFSPNFIYRSENRIILSMTIPLNIGDVIQHFQGGWRPDFWELHRGFKRST